MISEQHRMMPAGKAADGLGEIEVAGTEIRDERQPSDPHHIIGSDRRQHVFRVDLGKAGDRDRMRRMQMHDRTGVAPLLVHHAMQKALLGRWIT